MRKQITKRKQSDYEIGWGRPPKANRYKPGESGNPRGRPRARKSQLAMFSEALAQRIQIEEGGVKRSVTVLEAIIKRFTMLALRGDLKAIKLLLEIKTGLPEPMATPQTTADMSLEEIQRIYFAAVRRVR